MTDATVHSVGMLAAAFVILLVFGLVVGYISFRLLSGQETVGPPASPLSNARVLPPHPRLQVNGHEDLEEYLQRQQQTLGTYGWVDRQEGVVRIPIDRAIDVLLERGLPVRAPEPAGHIQQAARRKSSPATAASKLPPAGSGNPGSVAER
ncbi:MAG TPA: hypothetical protein VL523_03180 [Terriglobia bacterium]|nr:hypothetical protein [Terriglobia bacterium]